VKKSGGSNFCRIAFDKTKTINFAHFFVFYVQIFHKILSQLKYLGEFNCGAFSGEVFLKTNMLSSIDKKLVGAVEKMCVVTIGMDFQARIDTGARTTSLHAIDINVQEGEQDKQRNIGKFVEFKTINEQGAEKELRMKITNVTRISNAQGIEYRYMVKMNLLWKGCLKQVDINLRDRSLMKYKLLIGRDWLRGDFLVDVEIGDT
jgi:hypothetical protein